MVFLIFCRETMHSAENDIYTSLM